MHVLVIGLDGSNLSILESMSALGAVPRLDTLRQEGAEAPLESQLPPWTPSAWPSMYTGVNPGKHGVFDFLRFDGYDWDVVNRSHVKEFALWELLSMHGLSSVVVNVPVTHPPPEFEGALVPGYIAPEEPRCHPSGVWNELQSVLGTYSIYGNTLDSRASDAALVDDLVDLARSRGQAFRHLTRGVAPDFGFVQFQATDTVFHQCPHDEAAIRRVYRAVDEEVGKILDEMDADLTLVVSDHGMGPMNGREFRVNEFLRENGWLETTPEGAGMPSWKSATRQRQAGNESLAALQTIGATGIELAARAGLTSQRISTLLEHLGMNEWVLDTVPVDLIRAGTEQVDFPTSTAYMRTRTEMGVRLNLEGREPEGTVPPGEYERIRSELIDALEQVSTPEDEQVFERVEPREEIFDGPYVGDAPDIVIVPNRFDHFLVANLKGATFGDPTEPYEHKREGVCIASGELSDRDPDLASAHLFDIAPTILASFGVPISDRMDGSPLPIVTGTERESYPAFDPSPVDTDSAAVEARLTDLGYLQ